MARPRQRVCLQDGLKLDLNRLARKGFVRHGANIGGRGITWTHSYWGEIATGFITADMTGEEGWFRIQLGSLDQWITLVSRSRHFGGRQWYFMCPTRTGPRRCFGSRPAQSAFAAGKLGASPQSAAPLDPGQ